MKHLALIALTLMLSNFAHALKVRPYQCPVAAKCAAPPEKCDWSMEVDKKGCIVGCGELVCEIQECGPVPDCAAPPEGCNYNMEIDANGCVIGCGKLVCGGSGGTCENIMAPVCASPQKGCHWNMQPGPDGCPSCGELICGTTCENVQAPQCAAPPVGCNWSMQPGPDGCPSCGQLICEPAGGGGYNGPMGKQLKR